MNIFKEISNQICNDAKRAATMTKERSLIILQEEVADYETSNPVVYVHTYNLLNSPKATPVTGGNKNLTFTLYMDEGIAYKTGSYTGAQVISATEVGHSGTIGNHGYFNRSENQIPNILDECFGVFFG